MDPEAAGTGGRSDTSDGDGERAESRGGTRSARREPSTPTDPGRLLRRSARRKEWIPTSGGSTLHLLVLSSTREDTTVVDLATRTVMRVRVPWPETTIRTSPRSTSSR